MSYSRNIPLDTLSGAGWERKAPCPIPGGPTSNGKPAPRNIPLGPTIPYQKQGSLLDQPSDGTQVAGLGDFLTRLLGGGLGIGPTPGAGPSTSYPYFETHPSLNPYQKPAPIDIPKGLFQKGAGPGIMAGNDSPLASAIGFNPNRSRRVA
jgi:hypothetical protein